MKNLLVALFAICTLNIASATQETRTVGTYNQLKVCCGVTVNVVKGDKMDEIVVESNIDLNYLTTEVKNGVLVIGLKEMPKNIAKNRRFIVNISQTNLSDISLSSGASLSTKNTIIDSDDCNIKTSSGASAKLEVRVNKVSISASSGSSCNVSGTAKEGNLNTSSGSSIECSNLKLETAVATSSSGSRISLSVTKELTATASSGASIRYTGELEKQIFHSSSGASIRKR